MQNNQLIVPNTAAASGAASNGWIYWLVSSAATSTVNTATTAATDSFLRTIVNPGIVGASVIVGWTASLIFSGMVSLTSWGASSAAGGVSALWSRATQPTPTFQGSREENLGFY